MHTLVVEVSGLGVGVSGFTRNLAHVLIRRIRTRKRIRLGTIREIEGYLFDDMDLSQRSRLSAPQGLRVTGYGLRSKVQGHLDHEKLPPPLGPP